MGKMLVVSVLLLIPSVSFGIPTPPLHSELPVVMTEDLEKVLLKNQVVLEGLGQSVLGMGTISYERTLTRMYTVGLGLGFNPTEVIKIGGYHSSGIMSIPAYLLITPWSGSLRPFFTGGLSFQIGLGKKVKGDEAPHTFLQDWLDSPRRVDQGLLDQGPVLLGGAGLEYRFFTDWLVRATGYGLYFMKSDHFSPWAGLSLGRQF
ncbi:MAG TPA: hypothetical protein VJL87_01430 [Bdellovibrionota bacterium]|nr:hypothetical protein [Bdellovibrionota bacterium]